MSRQSMEITMDAPPSAAETALTRPRAARGRRWREAARVACLPIAAVMGLLIHFKLPNQGYAIQTSTYPGILAALLIAGIACVVMHFAWARSRQWLANRLPLLAAAVFMLCLWELLTIKATLLPVMYFPGPGSVIQTLIDDRGLLFNSTWHSLTLLFSGYAVGVVSGLLSGITMGWSGQVRYWGMPVLKIVGPIPATAWIPMALILFPQSIAAGVFLIALAVWFPVTMLTASGVANTRASYLDVARTLGASRWFLIFHVAIPAAMPSIFIGLFMGLGTSFLTLLVAESTGVSSGLGWYIDWARNYSDYNKVFAALVIMAAFFSTIMTLLFAVRDRILVWQKGTIKW